MKLAIVSPNIEAKSCPSAVFPDLRHGVLGEDVDADDDHEDAADDAQQGVVLLDLGLEHRVEEQGGHGHERVGAGDSDSGDDARFAAFRERALDAEHGHGADGDRCRDAHADASEEEFQNLKSHVLRLSGVLGNKDNTTRAQHQIYLSCPPSAAGAAAASASGFGMLKKSRKKTPPAGFAKGEIFYFCRKQQAANHGRDETIRPRHRSRRCGRTGPLFELIAHSSSEFILDFATVLPGVSKAHVKSRIILTPEHAKRLLWSLQENIARYESSMGKIEIPTPNAGGDSGPKMGQA